MANSHVIQIYLAQQTSPNRKLSCLDVTLHLMHYITAISVILFSVFLFIGLFNTFAQRDVQIEQLRVNQVWLLRQLFSILFSVATIITPCDLGIVPTLNSRCQTESYCNLGMYNLIYIKVGKCDNSVWLTIAMQQYKLQLHNQSYLKASMLKDCELMSEAYLQLFRSTQKNWKADLL